MARVSVSLSLSRPHLRHPEISTAFIASVNNALKVSDRLESTITLQSVRLKLALGTVQ